MSGFDDDDLGKDIAAAIEVTETASPIAPSGDAPLPSGTPPDTTVAKAPEGERPRGPDGKFIEKPAAAEKKSDAPAVTATGAQAQAPTQATVAPPQNWKGAGKVHWNRLPPAIQAALTEDYTRQQQADVELGKFRSVITPERAQALIAETGSVEQGLQRLLAISDIATQNPIGFVQWFLQQRGIDPRQLAQGATAQGEQPPAEAPHPIMQEVVQLRNQVQSLIQQQTQGAQTQVMSEIDAFSRDPAHPYFNDVREHMGALMKAGKAANLQEAYDMATWAVPQVRKSLLEQQTQAAMQANAQKVQQARQAAGSLTGSPAGANVGSDEPTRTLDEDIAKAVGAALGG